MYGTNLLVLLGLAFYLGASFVLWQLLLKEPAPSASPGGRPRPRRWPIRLAKAVITLLGGAASGAATLLGVATVVNAGKAGTPDPWGMLAVWAVGAVVAMLFIGRAPLIRRAVTRTCLALGVQGGALPLATLVSFVVAGARAAGSPRTRGGCPGAAPRGPPGGRPPAAWSGLRGVCAGPVV